MMVFYLLLLSDDVYKYFLSYLAHSSGSFSGMDDNYVENIEVLSNIEVEARNYTPISVIDTPSTIPAFTTKTRPSTNSMSTIYDIF